MARSHKKKRQKNIGKKTAWQRKKDKRRHAKLAAAVNMINSGRLSEAETLCRQIVKISSHCFESYHLLGVISLRLNNFEKAEYYFRQAVKLGLETPALYLRLGISYFNLRKYHKAISAYQHSIDLSGTEPSVFFNLGHAFYIIEQWDHARSAYLKAIELKHDYYQAYTNLAVLSMDMGRNDEALKFLTKSIKINHGFADSHFNLGSLWCNMGEFEKAESSFNRALELQPEHQDAVAALSSLLERHNKHGEAYSLLVPYVTSDKLESELIAIAFANVSSELGKEREAIGVLQGILDKNPVKPDTHRLLHFTLGSLHDKIKQYDRAFEHFQRGNELREMRWGGWKESENCSAIGRLFKEDMLPLSSSAVKVPVFVVGMPRSGTSLIEQVLSCHSKVLGAGELKFISDIVDNLPSFIGTEVRYPEVISLLKAEHLDELSAEYLNKIKMLDGGERAERIVDKMPGNFKFLGLIHRLFPSAPIIHCIRDPMDTCLSCYFQNFSKGHPYKNDLKSLGLYYRQYCKLMDFWKEDRQIPMLEVRYEEMVNSQECVTRALVEFCGLEWEEACLDFHRSSRLVLTASYQQVRKPIYNTSVSRWKNYEKYLGSLREVLDT